MTLDPNFALTPRNSFFNDHATTFAKLLIFGPSLHARFYDSYRQSFDKQHENDELFFHGYTAADPAVDYSSWSNIVRVPFVRLYYDLSSFGANKELALVFGFDAETKSRVLVYSEAAPLDDVTLEVGDNQFLMEVESLGSLYLYFVHAGGFWFFRGITGYVI